MRREYPTVEQIRELPKLGSETVPAKWEDVNGHANVGYYLSVYNNMGWSMFGQIGVSEDYFRQRRLGFVDLENHTRYLSELHVGDAVSAYGRYLAHDAKRVHGMVFIVNDDAAALACSIEFLAIGIDLERRRAAEIPDDVRRRLAALTDGPDAPGWAVPTCMTLG